jgi:predicted PurR-regulated permease PerM
MSFPAPTPRQARILWVSLTSLAVAVVLVLIGLVLWGLGWVIQQLTSVLLPIALAGIIAYLLDPLIDFLVARKVPRPRAILLVFFLAIMLVLILLATVVPQLVFEAFRLANEVPELVNKFRPAFSKWLEQSPLVAKFKLAWDQHLGVTSQAWLTKQVPQVTAWIGANLTKVASWAGFLAGLALVPVYVFYFLLEKRGIERNWTDYLPLQESKAKAELVFVLQSINECLIVFFRGQVLVALCDGALLTIGFLAIGLNYAFLLGLLAGFLSIVPFLGVMISLVPAVILAIVQFGDWLHPLLVLGIFGAVQMLEGLFISPKIIGDRVGLHPLTIIIAVMVGTTLLGGILGGVLAIPLTAALRTLMFRYVWKRRAVAVQSPAKTGV